MSSSRVFAISSILLCSLFAAHSAGLTRLLATDSDIQAKESYDRIHQLVVLDQIDNYLKPIESLETRSHKSLNGLWDFCFDPDNEGHKSRWHEKRIEFECNSVNNFYKMPVPSAFNDILSNKTARNYMGWMWYQTVLEWPMFAMEADGPRSWVLQFESVNYLCVIWMQIIHANGPKETHQIGSHAGGHLPVTLDLSDLLNGLTTQRAFIRLTVAVSNLLTSDTIPSGMMLNETEFVGRPFFRFQPDFDFFHFAGIMGDVNLVKLPVSHIVDVEFGDYDWGRIVKVALNQAPSEPRRVCYMETNILDPLCEMVANGTQKVTIKTSSRDYLGSCRITLARDRPEQPLLEDILDLKYTRKQYDIPKIPTRAQDQDFARVLLRGFGMHHEQLFSGRTMSLPAIMKDLYLLKQMGANLLRTSHYPYSRAYLDACDDLDLLVIAEGPAVGLNSFSPTKLLLHKQILKEMMQRDHRHPSIIMWSLANEPQSQKPEARDYFAKLVGYARTELRRFTQDAGRPLTVAIAQSHRDDLIGDLFDVIMINRYYGWYDCTGLVECVRPSLLASLEGWATKHPGKPLMVSEFGADTLAGFHSSTSDIFSEEFQRDLLVEHECVFDELTQARQTQNTSAPNRAINFIGCCCGCCCCFRVRCWFWHNKRLAPRGENPAWRQRGREI